MGEIEDYRRRWPPRHRRRRWLSVPGNILILPAVSLIGLGPYLAGALGTLEFVPWDNAPSMLTSDRDCRDFASRWEAQWFYWQAGSGDPHRLDNDGDGLACEFNPRFDLPGWFAVGTALRSQTVLARPAAPSR